MIETEMKSEDTLEIKKIEEKKRLSVNLSDKAHHLVGIPAFSFGVFLIIALVLAVAPIIACHAMEEGPFVPWDFNKNTKEDIARNEEVPSVLGSLLIQSVKTYQRYISPVKAGSCPMYPSCSAYSIEAIRKHGALIGFAMTADRLIHENNEMDDAPLIMKGGALKYFDPVSNNDFWWYK